MGETFTYTNSYKWEQVCLDGEMWGKGATTWPGGEGRDSEGESQGNSVTWSLRKSWALGSERLELENDFVAW